MRYIKWWKMNHHIPIKKWRALPLVFCRPLFKNPPKIYFIFIFTIPIESHVSLLLFCPHLFCFQQTCIINTWAVTGDGLDIITPVQSNAIYCNSPASNTTFVKLSMLTFCLECWRSAGSGAVFYITKIWHCIEVQYTNSSNYNFRNYHQVDT